LLHITVFLVFYLQYIEVHPNFDHIYHQHFVNCFIYRIFGHKTRHVRYVNITSLRSRQCLFVQIPGGTLRHARDASGARQHLVHHVPDGNGARRLIDGSGASITTSVKA